MPVVRKVSAPVQPEIVIDEHEGTGYFEFDWHIITAVMRQLPPEFKFPAKIEIAFLKC